MIRRLLPASVKVQIRLLQRRWNDRSMPFATSREPISDRQQVAVKQVIKKSHLFENKVHNLQLAARSIERIVILPGEVFSFWKTVGNPSEANGYKAGRNIVNSVLREATGGGLCQLSGIIYHTALLSGLAIVERYNHTIDIYAEEDRFTPLGADATVVYGYKDLRIRNPFSTPVRFTFSFGEETIECQLNSETAVQSHVLRFQRTEKATTREVETRNAAGTVLAMSVYRLP